LGETLRACCTHRREREEPIRRANPEEYPEYQSDSKRSKVVSEVQEQLEIPVSSAPVAMSPQMMSLVIRKMQQQGVTMVPMMMDAGGNWIRQPMMMGTGYRGRGTSGQRPGYQGRYNRGGTGFITGRGAPRGGSGATTPGGLRPYRGYIHPPPHDYRVVFKETLTFQVKRGRVRQGCPIQMINGRDRMYRWRRRQGE